MTEPLYQRRRLDRQGRLGAALGAAGPLPQDVAEANLSPDQLARAGQILTTWRGSGWVVAEAPSPAARWIHKLLFMQRLTLNERAAIRGARAADPVVDDFLYLLEQSEQVNLEDATVSAGLGYLVAEGLLASGRPAEILAD